METTKPERVAVEIDWENIAIALKKENQASIQVERLIARARTIGNLVSLRAYADWIFHQGLGRVGTAIIDHGVELVQMRSQTTDGVMYKNGADVALAAYSLELGLSGAIDTLVLASGDGDLTPVVRILKRHGVRVIVATTKRSASSQLRALADEVWEWQRDVDPTTVTDGQVSLAPAIDTAVRELQAWITAFLRAADPHECEISNLGAKIRYHFTKPSGELTGYQLRDVVRFSRRMGGPLVMLKRTDPDGKEREYVCLSAQFVTATAAPSLSSAATPDEPQSPD